MGTTCSGVIIPTFANVLYLVNIGDSRTVAYNLHGHTITATLDHKPVFSEEIRRITKAGGKVLNVNGINRIDGELSVSRAFGDEPLSKHGVLPLADVYQVFSKKVHTVVLGTDGLWDVINSEQLNPNNTSEVLAKDAHKLGSHDNITVMRIHVEILGRLPKKIDIASPIPKKAVSPVSGRTAMETAKAATVLSELKKFADHHRNNGEGFRATAYIKAIKALKELKEIPTDRKELMLLPGIGKSIADKIIAIQEGNLEDKIDMDIMDVFELFLKVWGIGPAKARDLYQAGARTIKDLHKKKYTDMLTKNQLTGLKYYEELQIRVPYKQVGLLGRQVVASMKEYDSKVKAIVCGSFRRKLKDCGDIDILVTGTNNLVDMMKTVSGEDFILETLASGEMKWMGIAETPSGQKIRIDVELVKREEIPYAVLYFTGSDTFNKKQRSIALNKGYHLSEHGLKSIKTGEYVKGLKTEHDVFEFLGMEYVEPEDR